MTDERTELGLEVEAALKDVLAHARGEWTLRSRVIDDPSKAQVLAIRAAPQGRHPNLPRR